MILKATVEGILRVKKIRVTKARIAGHSELCAKFVTKGLQILFDLRTGSVLNQWVKLFLSNFFVNSNT